MPQKSKQARVVSSTGSGSSSENDNPPQFISPPNLETQGTFLPTMPTFPSLATVNLPTVSQLTNVSVPTTIRSHLRRFRRSDSQSQGFVGQDMPVLEGEESLTYAQTPPGYYSDEEDEEEGDREQDEQGDWEQVDRMEDSFVTRSIVDSSHSIAAPPGMSGEMMDGEMSEWVVGAAAAERPVTEDRFQPSGAYTQSQPGSQARERQEMENRDRRDNGQSQVHTTKKYKSSFDKRQRRR
ncbi:hypothetical protein M231_08013 [Tremella mesenterica]|uniref:Uncharacterized protein n=1 Tax=Tremella mesenterica TaxID=5217 RepID=A0A4Q1BAQ8_TREME|nr:hypothetical protein M231_08013 [Tremella mesenterica]